MCLYPKLIQNPKYRSTKKNGGIIPPILDEGVKLVPIGCGKCMECRKKKARDWQVRLHEELRHNKIKGYFMTLTFSEQSLIKLENIAREQGYEGEGYDLDNKMATIAVRRFLENWRVQKKKSLRHWLVTELGHAGTERIHLHGIIWTDEPEEEIKKFWKYGFSDTGKYVSEISVNYIVKYVHKIDKMHKYYNPKMFVSNGIGKGYLGRSASKNNKYQGEKTDELYVNRQGYKMAMPIYYRNKLWTEEQREQLWIMKLNKQERYVMGAKIDVSTEEGEQDYRKWLRIQQGINKTMGFGDDTINWNERRYEQQRRNLKKRRRLQKQWAMEH